jgi:hypothetical protein
MTAWDAIFIDTCIFDAQQFDFKSSQFTALVAATKKTEIKLLLPHPVLLEIDRHINTQTEGAVTSLKTARRNNSFLRELSSYPQSRDAQKDAGREIFRKIKNGLNLFLKKFEVIKLDYSTINLDEIMRWYDNQEAPFGAGEKRKEFPDAFTFAMLRNYAREKKANIAVISTDNDLLKACERETSLHYFPVLSSFINSLNKEAAHFKDAIIIAEAAIKELKKQIGIDFPGLSFDHEIDPDGDSYVGDVEVIETDINPDDFDVIGLGHESFTLSFRATVKFSAFAKHVDADSWMSMGDGDITYLHTCEGTIEEETEIDCVARITTDTEWKHAKKLTSLLIEDHFITVHSTAPEVDDRDEEEN